MVKATNVKEKKGGAKAASKKGRKSSARDKVELEARGQARLTTMERPKNTVVEAIAEKLYEKQLKRIELQTDEKRLREELDAAVETEKVELPYVFKGLIIERDEGKPKIKVHLAESSNAEGVE